MSSVAICAICFEDARPILEDLQSISSCGHIFHEPCLQQWMEHCPAGRDPTCPSCKRSISCPAHDVHRLYFQSAGSDSIESQVSPSRNLQTAVEDPKHVNCFSAFYKLKSKLDAAMTFVYVQFKELESQVAVNLLWAENAKARSELARCTQDLTSIHEELMCCALELEKVGEEILAMKMAQASREQTRWDRFSGVIRVLHEDRENWPWNLLKAYVLKLVELAKMGHNVWTS